MLHTLLLILQVGAQIQAAPPRDTTRTASAPASVSGRITDWESGQPIPRALVTLTPSDRSEHLEAVADQEGRYEFTGLRAGEFAIWAGPPELRSTHLRQAFEVDGPMDSFMLPRANLELKPGEARAGVDMALARALGIEGRVLDPFGDPMAGVRVHLTRANGTPVSKSASDDRGAYRLFGLAPGRYRVCAAPSNRFADAADDAGRLVRTCHPGSLNEAGASDVVLTSRDASGIDIRIQRSHAHSISGTVRDAAGNRVAGAHVGAYSLDASGTSGYARSVDGEFVLKGLTPGRYLVTGAVHVSPMPEPRRGGPEPEMGFMQVDVYGDMSGLTLDLFKGRSLSGRVTFKGEPVPPAKQLRLVVQTRLPRDLSVPALSRPPFSPVDDNLHFTLTELFRIPLAIGIYNLPDGWALEAVRYGGRDITDIPTDFGEADPTRSLEVVLTNRVARPSVRVADEQGQPLTAYRVVVLPGDSARWKVAPAFITDAPARDGTVTLGPLAPGEYLIAALSPSDVMIWNGLSRARTEHIAEMATRVRLNEGDDRTIELRLVTLPGEIR